MDQVRNYLDICSRKLRRSSPLIIFDFAVISSSPLTYFILSFVRSLEKDGCNMSIESTLFDIFDHMSLAEKHEIVAELQRRIDAEECMAKYLPEKTYLEKNWEEIMRLIYELSCEPYIDDQYEIEEIWDKVEEMIRSGKLTSEPWRVRWTIIRDISDNDEYDYYGVCDPMRDLVRTLITNDEEKKQFADYLWETPYHSRELADKLYQELGEYDRHLEYIEDGEMPKGSG